MSSMVRSILIVCALCLLAACTAKPDDQNTATKDPYENTNRKIFAFNLAVDDYALEPAANLYRKAAPELVQKSIRNYVSWAGMPSTAVNSGLQGKFENAALASLTFLINGMTLGFIDLMEDEDQPEREDFGQTLASAGVNQGPYLVIPFLSSNTVRSASGRAVDMVLNPLDAFRGKTASDARTTLPVVSAVSLRAAHFDTINDVKNNSLDAYVRARSAYYQQRDKLLQDNLPKGEDDDLDEFEIFFTQ